MKTPQERSALVKAALPGNPGSLHTAVLRSAIYVACEGTNLIPRQICDDFAPVGQTLSADDLIRLSFLADFLELPEPDQTAIDFFLKVEDSNR